MENIADRVARMEADIKAVAAQNRRMKAMLAIAAVLASLPYIVGAWKTPGAQQRVVEAEEFRVVSGGKLVASLGDNTDRGGRLRLFNNAGKPLVLLSAEAQRGLMSILEEHGKVVGQLTSNPDGGMLRFFTGRGQPIALLKGNSDGTELRVYDKDIVALAGFRRERGGGLIQVYKADGNRLARIGMHGTMPDISLWSPNRRDPQVVQLYVGTGRGHLTLSSDSSNSRVSLFGDTPNRDGGIIDLIGRDGTMRRYTSRPDETTRRYTSH